MYTYEVAPVVTLMEHELIRRMGEPAGFPECEGVLAPGGSLSNLMALLLAREQAIPGCKEKGLHPGMRLTLFLSGEAHYSMRRAAAVAGLGLKSVVDVQTGRLGQMIPPSSRRPWSAPRSSPGGRSWWRPPPGPPA